MLIFRCLDTWGLLYMSHSKCTQNAKPLNISAAPNFKQNLFFWSRWRRGLGFGVQGFRLLLGPCARFSGATRALAPTRGIRRARFILVYLKRGPKMSAVGSDSSGWLRLSITSIQQGDCIPRLPPCARILSLLPAQNTTLQMGLSCGCENTSWSILYWVTSRDSDGHSGLEASDHTSAFVTLEYYEASIPMARPAP